MKFILRLLLFPIILLFGVLLHFMGFLLAIGTGFLAIVAALLYLIGFFYLLAGSTWGEILTLWFFAFLLSPWGLPYVGERVLGILRGLNGWLKSL